MTPGQRLKKARESMGKLQAEMAADLGFKWYKIKDIEIGAQKLTPIIARKLEKIYSIDFRWLLTGEGSMFGDPQDKEAYVSIPLLGAVASAGPGRENEDDEIIDYCKFKASWIRKFGSPRNLALMTISGDSMAPTLSKGDVIMIDKSETAPRDDRIYVINSGGSTVIKRLQLRGKSVWALSDNEKTNPPYQIEKDSNIIGRIVWFGRKLI
jgi:phage repressor protein C with HTH and peptisase S24 domain